MLRSRRAKLRVAATSCSWNMAYDVFRKLRMSRNDKQKTIKCPLLLRYQTAVGPLITTSETAHIYDVYSRDIAKYVFSNMRMRRAIPGNQPIFGWIGAYCGQLIYLHNCYFGISITLILTELYSVLYGACWFIHVFFCACAEKTTGNQHVANFS